MLKLYVKLLMNDTPYQYLEKLQNVRGVWVQHLTNNSSDIRQVSLDRPIKAGVCAGSFTFRKAVSSSSKGRLVLGRLGWALAGSMRL